MKVPKDNLRVLIAYNEPEKKSAEYEMDYVSELGVTWAVDAIYEALQKLNYTPERLGIKDIVEDIANVKKFDPDVIINLAEAYRGVSRLEMNIAGVWELLGIPYTGNVPIALGIGQNKILTKNIIESQKIDTPPYQVYTSSPDSTYLEYPLIVKPSREDASVGITQKSVVENFSDLKTRVDEVLRKYKQPVLVEKLIYGRELNISILEEDGIPRVLPISEIDFSQLKGTEYYPITSYEAKWIPGHPVYDKTPPLYPANVDKDLKARLEKVGLEVFSLLTGRDYARIDTRVDSNGTIYVLEFNPNPDISLTGGYTQSLKAAGIAYEEFINILIKQALKRMNYDQN